MISFRQIGHYLIDINQRNMLNAGIFQNVPSQQTVAAAHNQHALRIGDWRQSGSGQRFVITRFVKAGKLQIAIQKQPRVIFISGQDNFLIRRLLLPHHRIFIRSLVNSVLNFRRKNEEPQKQHCRNNANCHHNFRHFHLLKNQNRNANVQSRHQICAAHQTKIRKHNERE